MSDKKILSLSVEDIKAEDVPDLISSQFALLQEIQDRVKVAMNSALSVKQAVVNQVGSNSASGTKDAVEKLNKAAITIANSQLDSIRAQTISFEYQQTLAETTKFLFCLGLTNISMNRVVVDQLELKLKNASESKIDELARKEIENLLKQLKAQQDVDKRQQDLAERVKEQHNTIKDLTRRIDAQEKMIEELKAKLDSKL